MWLNMCECDEGGLSGTVLFSLFMLEGNGPQLENVGRY